MKIAVILQDGSTVAVTSDELDELLEKKTVLAFRRADEWAMVGVDSVRDSFRMHGSSWRDRKGMNRRKA